MNKAIQAFALSLALSMSAYAGDMQCPVVPPTPPASMSIVQEAPTTNDSEVETGKTDNLTETVLNLFVSVLALL